MNVGIAVQHNYPADREVRTRRFAKLLNSEDMEVTVLARNTTEDPARGTVKNEVEPAKEKLDYAIVKRFSWLCQTRAGKVVTAALPINVFWILWLYLNFREDELDGVIACGLRAGLPSIIAGRLLGIPVIVDIRENYPAFVETISHDGFMGMIVYDSRVVDLLERVTVRLADGVIVVADVRAEQLVSKGVDPEQIVRVMNVPLLSETQTQQLLDGSPSDSAQFIRLVYLGVIREPRGIQTIIRSLPAFDELPITVEFAIAGDGPHVTHLKNLTKELDVEDHVVFHGYIDSEEITDFLQSGTIGVVPHKPNAHWKNTVPNKIFDYMSSGLPVIATETPPIRKLFSEVNCGTTIPEDAHPDQICETVVNMLKGDLQEKGENGQLAVRNTYNWEVESQNLLELLEEVTNPKEKQQTE